MSTGDPWPVVDCHAHVGVSSTCTFIAEEALIPWMDQGQIDIQFVFQLNQSACHHTPEWNPYTGNDYIARIQHMFPERVYGLASINPWLQPPRAYTHPATKRGTPFDLISRNLALEECERVVQDLGLWGVKMHPREHGYPVNHWTIRQMLDKLCSLQKQAARPLIILVHAAADSNYNTPEALGAVAKDYPDLLFLMAHAGYMWGLKTVYQSVGHLENVLFDLTTCPDNLPELTEKCGVNRFVAGSDGPFASARVKQAIVESIFPNPDDQAFVLGGNLVQRLGLPCGQQPETRRKEHRGV